MSDEKAPRILVAEDNPELLSLVCEVLTAQGAEIKAVSNGEEAVKEALLSPYDLFLVDIEMPGMDGIQVCRQLRSMAFTRTTPVLVLTGKSDIETVNKAVAAGAWDYQTKPIHSIMLWQRITNMLHLKRTRDASRGISESMEQAAQ